MQAIAQFHLIIFTTVILVENYVEEWNVLSFVLQLSFETLSAPKRGLSRKYPSILNISRTGRVALM